MRKIKSLLPTLKENKRYILYEIDSMKKIQNQENIIKQELRGFIGDLGLAKAGLKFIKQKENRGIIQVTSQSLNDVKTGLSLISNEQDPIRIRTIKVSGVINKLSM
mgnify:FL=1